MPHYRPQVWKKISEVDAAKNLEVILENSCFGKSDFKKCKIQTYVGKKTSLRISWVHPKKYWLPPTNSDLC